MTRDEEIQATRKLLQIAESIRDSTVTATGPAKDRILGMADASIAKAKMRLTLLEQPLSAHVATPGTAQ